MVLLVEKKTFDFSITHAPSHFCVMEDSAGQKRLPVGGSSCVFGPVCGVTCLRPWWFIAATLWVC